MIRIRQATEKDLEGLLDLWEEFTGYLARVEPDFFQLKPDARNIYRRMVEERLWLPEHLILVAEDGDKLVGYHTASIRYPGEVFVQTPFGHISDLYLKASYRKQNLGQQMIHTAAEWFKTRGITHLDVKTFSANPKGQQFWEKNGFTAYEMAFKCGLEKSSEVKQDCLSIT